MSDQGSPCRPSEAIARAGELQPVLIAGPTGSGKSELALRIAEAQGGIVINADASQVFGCWRIVTARPDAADLGRAPHALYGHADWRTRYSAGHWLRDVAPLLKSGGTRPIVVGGTGLFFAALTGGLADIPPIAENIRAEASALPLDVLCAGLDGATARGLDLNNRARVQRAWEVLRQTGRGIAAWQARTPPPLLSEQAAICLRLDAPRDWLGPRLERRFDRMIEHGAIEEVAAMRDRFDPSLPAFKAIGVPELMAYLEGGITLAAARERAVIATRQYAKRQRTWLRARMQRWIAVDPQAIS